MTLSDRSWLMPMAVAALVAAMVAVMGATVTDLGPWYHMLRQPSWAPPDAAYWGHLDGHLRAQRSGRRGDVEHG